jgi:predicted acylesterase/phospholipase RssA
VEMRERRALVLAGGGSKGAFEVGAVRCLADVFGFQPDILCGASVGSLNAAKLAEGPGALAALESMWLGMQSSADLYQPTGNIARLVNDLHQLGITYIAGIDLADLLGVRFANYSWLSPNAEISVGVVKHMLGAVEGAGSVFTLTDIIFGAARAGLLIGKVKQDIEKVIASPSLFVFDPVRQKIDGNIDQSKIAKSGLELRIAMVNLDDGRTRYVDQRGRFVDNDYPVDLRDALQASAAIPIAFPPMTLPGGHYVDGGVRDNAPIAAADIAGASSAIAVLPSPEHMDVHDYTGAAFPTIAARSFEAIFDETWQNDLAPFRGYRMPVTIIAPQIETHSMLRVDPGLVQIDIDYGYMRAFDELQPTPAKRARLRQLALEIAQLRIEVWGPTEHESEGKIRDEQRGNWSYTQPVADSVALEMTRTAKHKVRARCEERVNLAKTLLATPAGIERAWQQWERHKWTPWITTPWEASTTHIGPFVPKLAPPPPLGPLPITEQHIVYRDPKGFVQELWWVVQTAWQAGAPGAAPGAATAAGDPAAYVLGESFHIVYRGTDDLIHELWWSPTTGWRVGTLTAAATTTPAAGDPHGYVLDGSSQHVVYRGTDDLIHELWWSPAGGWQVGKLSSTKLAAAAGGDPFGYELNGEQHVVYRGTDDLIHQLSWSASGGWHVGTLGTIAGATAAAGDPAAYVLGGTPHVVYLGTDKLIHELWWSAQSGWQLGTLSATAGATTAAGDPYGYVFDGNQHVVYRGTDDLIHDLWWAPTTGWQVGSVAATAGLHKADGDPVGYALQSAQHVVYRGSDDYLHEVWAGTSGAWQIGTLRASTGAAPAAGRPAAFAA